jgi:SPP1 family predicted phage head-tail adaptor
MVIIQRLTSVPNGMGGYVESWADLMEYSGVIDQLSGNEVVIANQLSPASTHVLIGEYVEGIQENDRVLFNDKVYDIKNIDDPMNLHRQLECLLEFKGVMQDD